MAEGSRQREEAPEWPEAEWLPEILDTIHEFGTASLELVAWELSLSEAVLQPAWYQAVERRLIESAGLNPGTDEQMYRLSPGFGRGRP